MDINCTHECIYQDEGKCNLTSSLTLSNSKTNDTDCPYFMKRTDTDKNPKKENENNAK